MDTITNKEIDYCIRLSELKPGFFSKKALSFIDIRRHIEMSSLTHRSFYFLQEMIEFGAIEPYESIGKRMTYVVNIAKLREYLNKVKFIGDMTAFETAKKIVLLCSPNSII